MFEYIQKQDLAKCYLGIDVGPEKSGFALFNKEDNKIIAANIVENSYFLKVQPFNIPYFNSVLIEYPDSVSPNVGNEFVKMIWEAGRIHQHFQHRNIVHKLGRKEVKKKVNCNNDTEVRRFLLNKYGRSFCKNLNKDAWQAFLLIHCYLQP